ncbi:hypothetical protein Bca52824_072273 [Brassica carinata]|uniref:tRNA-dihydrouridine(16/17) synthase [NAD(P)(+)] n=1 Tax=Brassica carinata TaxID=52824 RepID=A0A8X7QD12_BRACI|nr:hypothetical protein Bca52824_072273 [Brassica carinata]
MKPSSLSLFKFLRTRDSPLLRIRTMTQTSNPSQVRDDLLCSDQQQQSDAHIEKPLETAPASIDTRVEQAWAHWKKLGRPKYIVAPMVDNSELPFRLLCQKYGAQAAYTPMLHSRIFTETDNRNKEFTTCEEDRPLFVQFCANDPDTLLEAAKKVEPCCDYVDINLGCPQRIARRGNYGAFLMDNLPLVKSLVEKLAQNLTVPVSCKIRIFPNLQDTLNYAKMLEDAGCSLLASDWGAIKEVRNALRIPVLANGNVRCIEDVEDCIKETGVEGVLSAETLLENPAVFAGFRTTEWAKGSEEEEGYVDGGLDQGDLVVEYLKLCEKHPVPWRMIRSHVHKMLGDWFRVHPQVREQLNAQNILTFEFLYGLVDQLKELGGRVPLYKKRKIDTLQESPQKDLEN